MVNGGYLYPPRTVVSEIVAHSGKQREIPEANIAQRLASVGMDRGSRHARRRARVDNDPPWTQLNGKVDRLLIVCRGVCMVETGLIAGVLWRWAN